MPIRVALSSRSLLLRRNTATTTSCIVFRRTLATVSTSPVPKVKQGPPRDIQDAATLSTSSATTLPASWYRSDKLTELERRSIFSNSWYMTTITSEFTNPGDYRVFEFAGYSIFLVMGRDGEIRGFHNVCRHRAYPLRTQSAGCSGVISCGYHAWTFDLKGDLIKAPQFGDVPDFDKSTNSLYPVHLYITRSGCIFVNLEASEVPSVSFQEFFPGLEELLDSVDFRNFKLYKTKEHVGNFNWKTRMDGFQECYHCQVAHPSLSRSFDIKNYSILNRPNYSQHIAQASTSSTKDAYGNSDALFLYLFPSGAINCFKNGWQRSFTSPIDAHRTKVAMEYYVDPSMSDDEKDEFVRSFYEVFSEDCALCEKTQRSLDAGVYTAGVLHPTHESGVLSYQARVKQLVLEHAALEESLGREVNPASRYRESRVTEKPEDTLVARLEQREW